MEFNLPDRIPAHITRLIDHAVEALHAGDPNRASRYAKQAYHAAEHIQNKASLLAVYDLAGMLAHLRGDLSTAMQQYRMVLAYCRELQVPLGIASASHNLGLIAAQRGKWIEAEQFLTQAIEQYTTIGKLEKADEVRQHRAMITQEAIMDCRTSHNN